MSESKPSASKTLSWLLAIILIGVVALYSWHNENQTKALAGKDAEIAQSAQTLADSEKKLAQSLGTEKGLRAEMDTLNAQHSTEKQDLMGKLDAAGQANQALQGDMEALKTRHAQMLAAEQEKASQAYAALQGKLDAANRQVAALGANIEQQKQAMADAAAAHEAQMVEAKTAHEAKTLQLGHQLNEKIDFYRTALEGSDPERAAQLVGLELQAKADRQTIEDAQQAMQALREKEAGLNEQLASANQVVAERDQALAETGQKLEDTRAELTQERSALAQATEGLAATEQRLQAAEADHAKTKADAAAATQEAQGRISDLTGKLQIETAALVALRQKHKSMVAGLRGSLDATKQDLAGVEAALGATKDEAEQARRAHEQQIGEANAKIASLEGTLEQTRQKAGQDLETSRREGEETVAYVRNIYTELSKLGGRHTEQGMLLSLAEDELRFRVAGATLPEGELPSLDWIANLLNAHPKLTARIEGHSDSSGREETNLELSTERANAVKQALVDRGVAPDRLGSEGIGEARPIADNAKSEGRRKNRRVEVYVIEN